jgi:hypothetical protein
MKLTTRKKRRRDPHTARHAASRPDRPRPQRQQGRDPGLRLRRPTRGAAACGGPARIALDRSAGVARWSAAPPGRTPARYLPPEHHADHQRGALACDREFRRRVPPGCRGGRADRRATAASRAGSGRARAAARPSAWASGRPDARRREPKPRSQHGACAARDGSGRPVRKHTAGPDHRNSCPPVCVGALAGQADQVSWTAALKYAVTDPDCASAVPVSIAIAVRWRHLRGRARRLGLRVGRPRHGVMLGARRARQYRLHPDASYWPVR